MNDLGFVADAPDVGFVPDSTESDVGFVPDSQAQPIPVPDERQRKRWQLGIESFVAGKEAAKNTAEVEDLASQERSIGFFSRLPSEILNLPQRAANAIRPLINEPPGPMPFAPGKPIIPVEPAHPGLTGIQGGVEQLGAQVLSGLTTPEMVVTAPAAVESAAVRALFAGQMALPIPEQVERAGTVLGDINSTPAEKVVAVGEPVVNAAFLAALGKARDAGLHKSADALEQVTKGKEPDASTDAGLTPGISGEKIGDGKSNTDQNQLQTGASGVAGSSRETTSRLPETYARPELEASADWLEAVSKNDLKASYDAEKKLLGTPMGSQELQRLKVLVGANREWSDVRTSGGYARVAREAAAKERARSSQEFEQLGQQTGESSTGKPLGAYENPQSIKEEVNAQRISIPAGVPQPEVRAPVGESPPLRQQGEAAQVQAPAEVRPQEEVTPKEAPVVYRGHQPGYGKVPAMELYNLTETISPTLVKGSTVTEATLAKEGYSIPESAKPPKRKTLSELGRDLPDAGESGAVHIPFDDIINKVVERMRKVRDYVTIDPIPRLTRAMGGDIGTGNNSAIQHASARVAVPRMIDDLLAKVFQDQYKNPDEMRKTVEVINKDNILGGYDSFIQQAAAAQAAGHGSAAAHYRQMARDVANVHDLVGYERDVRAAQADPAITENIKRWNDMVNPQLDQLYNEMKGMDANTPRPGRGRIFGARVNLLPKSEEGRWIDALNDEEKPIPSPSSSNYRNPNAKKDKFDRRAKFTGEYSDNPAAVLANVLSHRWNEVTKIRFLNDLIRSGAGSWEKPADGLIHGKEAKPLPVKLPETKTEMVNGAAVDSATKQVEKTIWVPEDVVSDVRGIIDTDLRLKQNPIARGLTTLQLAQLADAFTHTKNLHSVIANAQGTKAMWSDVVRKMPGLSSLDTAGRITKVLYDITQDTPEIRAEMADMAKNGMLRQHFPATGLQKITKMQDMIHHVDTAARVVMNRFYDNLVERGMAVDTMPARRKFVQQVGEYNKRLMGPMMQSMSRAGFSPFIVAGRNFNRFGRRMLTGHPGFEATSNSAALKARLVNFTTLGTIFVLPMILNQVLTGNIYGRKGTPIGSVDMNTAVDEKGAHKVLDLASLYGVRRGMRATGVDSIVEGLRAGETPDNIVGKAIHDSLSTAAHPWAGPALGAAWQTLTGTRLDLRGGPTPVEARKVGDRFSGSQFAENARVAFKNQNPMLYSPFRPLFNDTEESAGKDFVKDWFLKTPATTVGIRDVKSPALSKAGELMGSYQKTPEQEEKSKLKRQLVKSLHEGDKAPLTQARKDKALENRDVEEVKERAKSPLIYMVKKLGAVDAVKVWELADENERKLITPIVNQHILNSTVLDTKEKRKYREQIGTLKPIDK